ncbi:MAG: hypothetical protein IPM23_05675 [Candidatus Melainabacteria bacterium]|nr:hypothetical protein [Candidatus Melainabacteria bacterium]
MTRAILSILAVLSVGIAVSAAPAVQSKETMLSITSRSDNGPLQIYLSSLGIRMRGKLGSSIWKASDPRKATLINPENKTYLELPVEEYIHELRDEDFPGIAVKRFESARARLPAGFNGKEYTVFYQQSRDQIFARVIGLSNSGIPEATHRMWCQYTGIRGADFGLPVSIHRIRGRHGSGRRRRSFGPDHSERSSFRKPGGETLRSILVPSELARKPLDPALFTVPKGYVRARDKAAFYLSQDGQMKQSDLEDFFRVPLQ